MICRPYNPRLMKHSHQIKSRTFTLMFSHTCAFTTQNISLLDFAKSTYTRACTSKYFPQKNNPWRLECFFVFYYNYIFFIYLHIRINIYSIRNDKYFFSFLTHIKKLNVPFKTYIYKCMHSLTLCTEIHFVPS